MDKLIVEAIVNNLFTVSGLDFNAHYSRFYKEGTAAINDEMRQWQQRVLAEFGSRLDSAYSIYDMKLESMPRAKHNELSFEEGKAYCEGWNACMEEHKERVERIKEIAMYTLTQILEKYSKDKFKLVNNE